MDHTFIFIGGPGRSGTSFFYASILNHPWVLGFRDTELKIFSDAGGFPDLLWTLTSGYSPDRANIALEAFGRLATRSLESALKIGAIDDVQYAECQASLVRFAHDLVNQGQVLTQTETALIARFVQFVRELAQAIESGDQPTSQRRYFVEKTPHNLLFTDLLERCFPGSFYFHIIRHPVKIARSLLGMSWFKGDEAKAAEWVKCYFARWETVRASSQARHIVVREIKIEHFVFDAERIAQDFCTAVDAPLVPSLFSRFDPAVLERKADGITADQLRFLSTELATLALDLGYGFSEPSDACGAG